MKKYFRKKLYVTTDKSKFVIVKLYIDCEKMQGAYYKECPKDMESRDAYKRVLGAHRAYVTVKVNDKGRNVYHNETGTIFLSFENCGAGVVTHEIMHAVLWAWKHRKNKSQYPIIIKNMEQEEEVLRNHTQATKDFYTWYWKVRKKVKEVNHNAGLQRHTKKNRRSHCPLQ